MLSPSLSSTFPDEDEDDRLARLLCEEAKSRPGFDPPRRESRVLWDRTRARSSPPLLESGQEDLLWALSEYPDEEDEQLREEEMREEKEEKKRSKMSRGRKMEE